MKAGKLRLRVSFLAPSTTRDSLGNPGARTTFAMVWGSLTPASAAGGTYKEKQEQVATENAWELGIRYLTGIDTSFHVSYGGRLFEIISIQDPDGRKRELHLRLIERNSGRG